MVCESCITPLDQLAHRRLRYFIVVINKTAIAWRWNKHRNDGKCNRTSKQRELSVWHVCANLFIRNSKQFPPVVCLQCSSLKKSYLVVSRARLHSYKSQDRAYIATWPNVPSLTALLLFCWVIHNVCFFDFLLYKLISFHMLSNVNLLTRKQTDDQTRNGSLYLHVFGIYLCSSSRPYILLISVPCSADDKKATLLRVCMQENNRSLDRWEHTWLAV